MPVPEDPVSSGRPDSLGGDPPVVSCKGVMDGAAIGALCAQMSELFREGTCPVVILDVRAVVDPDVSTIDALARLQLAARRMSCEIRLRHTSEQLDDLVRFTGLREVLPPDESDPVGEARAPSPRR